MVFCHRAFYDSDDLEAARRWLQKALHLAPAQPLLRFNIAAVMQQGAVRTLRKERPAGDTTKLEAYEAAAMDLNKVSRRYGNRFALASLYVFMTRHPEPHEGKRKTL